MDYQSKKKSMRWKNLFILWFLAAVISVVAAHDKGHSNNDVSMSNEEYSEEYEEEEYGEYEYDTE